MTGQSLLLRTTTGQQSIYVWDGTGDPAALITTAAYQAFGYSYDPYGTPTLTQNSGGHGVPENPYLFKGGIQDRTTGWVHFGARWYNPTTGQWTQQDTLDTPLNPAKTNRYAYAGGDPVNGIDPTGQLTSTEECTLAFVGVATIFGVLVGLTAGGIAAGVATAAVAADVEGTASTVAGIGTGVAGAFAC